MMPSWTHIIQVSRFVLFMISITTISLCSFVHFISGIVKLFKKHMRNSILGTTTKSHEPLDSFLLLHEDCKKSASIIITRW